MPYYAESDIHNFFEILHKERITYVLIKNIGEELPSRLSIGKDIDILVHPDAYAEYRQIMHQNAFKKIVHPQGKETGWLFLYAMDENSKFQHCDSKLEVDAYAQLPTKSLGINAWIPLDKKMQASIWENKSWDKENRWWQMDEENLAVYLVTRSVFEKNSFSDGYISEIEKRKELIFSEVCKEKLEMIFFRFTPHLLNMIKSGSYGDIFLSYLRFSDY